MHIETELKVEVLDPADLTKTETKVLQLICMGWLKPKIAAFLCRAYSTIDGHDENIRQKLHARSNNEVIAIAVANEMVKISRLSKSLCVYLAIIIPLMTMITDDARASSKLRNRLNRPIATRLKVN